MLAYLKDHILEEIEGAMDYMSKAIEHKKDPCGEKFYAMSGKEGAVEVRKDGYSILFILSQEGGYELQRCKQ